MRITACSSAFFTKETYEIKKKLEEKGHEVFVYPSEVEVDGKTKFACVDGPEFDGHKVNFDLLLVRQNMYCSEEKKSLNLYKEKCKCMTDKKNINK